MKKFILKSLLLIAGLLVSTNASAYDFEVDGIYYNIDGTNATVTEKEDFASSYSGDVVIPESVNYSGKTYKIISIGYYAFYCCSGLTSVTIPNSITLIGDYAFHIVVV